MENSLLVGLSRQMVLSRELDVVANNIANQNTNGLKSNSSMFQEYLMPVARQNQFPGLTDRQLSYVIDSGTWRNMGQGAIERTGNPLDVAIDGDAFLVVQTANGPRYTRNGALQVSSTGQLVTADGNVVQGDNGAITLQPNDHDISISADGRITVTEGGNNRQEFNSRPVDARQLHAAAAASKRRQQQLPGAGRSCGQSGDDGQAEAGLYREIQRQRRGRDEPDD